MGTEGKSKTRSTSTQTGDPAQSRTQTGVLARVAPRFVAKPRLYYTEAMERRVRAVYKHGVLHPIEPLELEDMQEVTVMITDKHGVAEDVRGYFTPEEWAAAVADHVTWDDVRLAFAGIVGSLSDVVLAERQER